MHLSPFSWENVLLGLIMVLQNTLFTLFFVMNHVITVSNEKEPTQFLT